MRWSLGAEEELEAVGAVTTLPTRSYTSVLHVPTPLVTDLTGLYIIALIPEKSHMRVHTVRMRLLQIVI